MEKLDRPAADESWFGDGEIVDADLLIDLLETYRFGKDNVPTGKNRFKAEATAPLPDNTTKMEDEEDDDGSQGLVGNKSAHESTASVSSSISDPMILETIMSETGSNNEPGSNEETGDYWSELSSTNLPNVENETPQNAEDGEIKEEEEDNSVRSSSESEEKSNIEKLLAIQENYEIYCPSCSSCITKTVILRERTGGKHADFVRGKPVEEPEEGHLEARKSSNTVQSPPQNQPDQERFSVELLKSTVYGGLTETITSLGVVSSASASGSSTVNILALAVANLAGGLIVLAQNFQDLRNSSDQEKDRYNELLGRRTNSRMHILVAVLSYIFFGLIPPLVYAFSFYVTGIKNYKLMSVFSVSLVCVILLCMIKVYVRKQPSLRGSRKSYLKSAAYYTFIVVASSGISYVVGDIMGDYMEKLGWFLTELLLGFVGEKSLGEPTMSYKRPLKRALILDDDDDEEDTSYSFKVLLPNSTSVGLTLHNPGPEMPMERFVNLLKEEYEKSRKDCLLMSKRTRIEWNLGGKFLLETNGEKMKGMVRFAVFKPNMCHIIRLDDGSGTTSTMYENLWDLTPDPDLLKEQPENYSFETALADLIDNSLQAVWPLSDGERKLIRVDVSSDRISVFDTGRGMDSSEENSIDKWGKIGASLHRSQKIRGVGGRPPYLTPFFGMFGYGGPYACMFLGRRTLVSSKTKESKKVFTLQFKKEALIDNRSISGKHWKTDGGMRDPTEEEMKLAPHGSFTKVEIFEPEFDISKVYQLLCRLKDIYFPYIQCDELSKTGKTERPVDFEVNGEDLAEIAGGEVAITNLNSRGEEFWFQIKFTLTSEKRQGRPQEANARLKFVYFPIVQGEESIEKILENLEEQGCEVSESFETFGRVSIRRLGRLLPEVRWDSIPFMKQGNRASTLQKSCQRVKCFVDLDAGFNPTPSKTALASQNPFTVALKNFGSKLTEKEKDTDVKIMIHREGKPLNIKPLEQTYRDWVMKMHDTHDEEAASGQDEPTVVVEFDKKALNISHDAVRVHKVITRKGKSWRRGQNIKILKGACAGVHHCNVYATIDYFIIEGFEDEPGGDTWVLCRPIHLPKNKGCMLSIIEGVTSLEVQSSLSLPIAIIDDGKCLPVDADEWNKQIEKQQEKAPSKIDLLDEQACNELKIDGGELPVGKSVFAGRAPPQKIVAVIRPARFTSSTPQKKLDQKHIVKDGGEMVMSVNLVDTNMKSRDKNAKFVCSERAFPTPRDGISGLYIFSLGSKNPNLFKKAGTYNFSFSIGDSIECTKTVVIKPSSKAAKWKLEDNLEPTIRVGSSLPPICVACFDEHENRVRFASVPSLDVKLEANPGFQLEFDKLEAKLIKNGSVLKIENMLVETGGLDQIRPNYEATLEIRAKDKPFSVSVDCKVIPGPVERVAMNNPQALDNLLPGSTVENFILEIFDAYNNHVAEGTDVVLHIDGYRIHDYLGVTRKVDASGCIDLSGILKVTEGYGKSVSFSVMSGNEEIFKKESKIQERELRLVTELPDSCPAGSIIQNLVFNVTDSDGSIDANIHDDEKSGCFHTMSIEFGSGNIESVRYAFIQGSCKVSTLSVPENESVFSFRVFHSRYPELHLNLEVPLVSAPTFESDEIGCSTPYSKTTTTPQSKMASTTNSGLSPTSSVGVGLTPCSQVGVLAIRSSSLDHSSQNGLLDMAQFAESLKQKLDTYGERKMKIDERLKCLEAEQGQAEQELSTLQASLEPISAGLPACLSTRESMMKKIEEKQHHTAAAVFCCLYRKAAPPQSMFLSNKGVFGIVALLGSVATTSLSRALSEYLGKDTMLALVCKSSQCGPKSLEYMRLKSEAHLLRRPITSRFLIICLDATRPWSSGLVENDPQRKLAMKNPCLPNGDPIPGFIGYAVNMIELDLADLDIQKNSGHGLRETLFYGVFGDLQVYQTGEYLQAALPHIKADCVSLDGVIFKENGFIYSGCCEPEIHFPITVTEKQEKNLLKLELARDRKRKAEKTMAEEYSSLRKVEKKLKKATEKYQSVAAAMADS
ncbi:unnamed protein product [Microthlaspi erraticum]|uniref:Uncharacterized protein n=1 Tax=Microthlaspi erraticum TaxID=1685480 RepID=A0A6D2I5J3_9BRAS|nr:unnamed protein product [Microthlaspi erraticum]